ncbi:hypothetical protein BG004_007023 [Podila humilis]|nr:hypothetical protein BG004_007023 [Podila humilis]
MEDNLSSSEAFAKALKGIQTSPAEKIRLARTAWERADVILPHKQEFLLEWLCSALIKSATPSKSPKDNATNVILDFLYWDLLKEMFSGITQSRRRHKKPGLTLHRHQELYAGAIDGQGLGVLLRIPVLSMFIAVIQKFVPPAPMATAPSTAGESPKKGRRSKRESSTAEKPQASSSSDSLTETPSHQLLETVYSCFEMLSGPLMAEWFQPTLEVYTPLAQSTLEVIIEMSSSTSNITTDKQEVIMKFSQIVLDRLKRLVIIQPNQRKVFTLLVGKMFEVMVRARVIIRDIPGATSQMCQDAICAILRSGLFHQEHLQEYIGSYNAEKDEKSVLSYQKQLFDHLSSMIKSEYSTAALDIMPMLLKFFIEESRKKQRSLANNGFERGMDNARDVEFAFFKILYVLAKNQLPHVGNEEASEASLEQLILIMNGLNGLLSAVLELNMYQPSNNEEADQYVFMSTSFKTISSYLHTAQDLSNGKLQSTSLAGIMALSQLDDRLLKPHLDNLWSILLNPAQEATDASLQLAKSLLEIYGKSSDLKLFLNSLFSAFREQTIQPGQLNQSPLFSRAFLDSIPSNIRNYLPLPQAPMILDIFSTELLTLDSGMEIDGLVPLADAGQKKKRKLNSGKSKDKETESGLRSAEPIIAIFIQFLKGLRITANQEKQLNKEFQVIYDRFLEKILSNLDNTAAYQSRRVAPALQLHYALCAASTQYWKHCMSMEFVQRQLVKTFQEKGTWSDTTVLAMNRVVLQHAHLTLCSSENFDDRLSQSCTELVRFTMKTSRLRQILDDDALLTVPWDGHLEHASGSAFLVASWQLQVNDWLDIICRFGTKQHMELIAEVIAGQFNTLADHSPRDTITIHKLNQILLRSANFYEVPNFRRIFAKKVLHGLSACVSALSESDIELQLASTISSLSDMDSATSATAEETFSNAKPRATFADSLQVLIQVIRQQSTVRNTKSKSKTSTKRNSLVAEQGPKLLSLLSIIHLLPVEYFAKFERNIVLSTMATLDYYVQRYLVADQIGTKCLLLGRRISNTIMSWRTDTGVLSQDPVLLSTLLNYAAWNCSTEYGVIDQDGVGSSTLETTCSMIESCCRYYLGCFSDPKLSESSFAHLDTLLNTALDWASSDTLRTSTVTASHSLSESRIKVILISRICQCLVQYLESAQTQKSKKSGLKKIATLEDRLKVMKTTVGKLFEVVEARTIDRIQSVIDKFKLPSFTSEHQVNEALQCMDHFELFRTLMQFRQLKQDAVKNDCLVLLPDLFQLDKALISQEKTSQDVAHLEAILTVYSLEYLAFSKDWKSSIQSAEGHLQELFVVVMRVSAQDLQENDMAMLKSAYLCLLDQLSDDHFEVLLQRLLKDTCDDDEEELLDDLTLVRYLDITFLGGNHGQKRKVRRHISKLLTRLIQILQRSPVVSVVVGVLDIVAGVCIENSFDLRSWEIGLALESITSLMSPATPLLVGSMLSTADDPSSSSSSRQSGLSNQDSSRIFTALYHILINIAQYRQDELTSLIPVFTAIVQGMFHGFKSLHASIAKKQQGIESLIKSPFMLLSAGTLQPENNVLSGTSSTVLMVGDPLPVECAENFARLLTALGSKGVSNHQGGSSLQESTEHSSTATAAAAATATTTTTTDASKAFSKHAPYILLEYFTIQCSVAASISQQSLRNALVPGLYSLLNLCGDWERELIMVGLDNTGKTLLKGLYADYLKYHKYTGR